MIDDRDTVLDAMVRRLVDAYRPERIWLFGSRARGEAGPDSDYDIAVVVPDDAPPEKRDELLAYRVLWQVGTSGDIVVWTKSAFDRRARVVPSLPATVVREGRVLYAA